MFQVSIKAVLKAISIPRSTYYYARTHKGRVFDDDKIIQAIDEIRQSDPKYTRKYGYRRMTKALKELGVAVNHKKVLRIITDRPYQKLVADVSEFRYGNMDQNNRVYLEPIIDLFSEEILAFNISEHPTVEFAIKLLKEALDSIPQLSYKTTVHTDQGFQYQRMFRKATCLDNASMESFFHIMKAEMMDIHYDKKPISFSL